MYQCGKGKSAIDGKLPVDVMQVKFDSSFADTQLVRNRSVGKTLGGETHDLAFAHSQDLPVRGAVRSVNTAHYMPQFSHSKTCTGALFRRNRSLASTLTGQTLGTGRSGA